MSKNKHGSYNRIHKYENPSEIEKGKIKRETTNYIKYNSKSKEISQKFIKDFSVCDDEMLDKYDEFNQTAEKEMKNAKTHKIRFKELSKNKDFI
jgi:TRAP-type mannitol/chloroaromatic compound transport system substrate-binding protein